MKAPLKYSVLALGLLASGALRGLWEAPLEREFHASGLLEKPLSVETRDRIGQTSWAVALGGLRTLVATFVNLRAFTFFTEQRWSEVAETYDVVVGLAPHTGYYWDSGAWHSAYNAAHYYRYDTDLPPLRAKAEWRASILRGRAFLERGIRNNPDNWELEKALGQLLSDSQRIPDYPAAAEAYRKASENPGSQAFPFLKRFVLYSLIRSPGREQESLEMARRFYADPSNRVGGLLCCLFVLEYRADPSLPPVTRAIQIFGGAQQAYTGLGDHWLKGQNFPMDGVVAALQGLETQLKIPADKSILKKLAPAHDQTPQWLRNDAYLENRNEGVPMRAPSKSR